MSRAMVPFGVVITLLGFVAIAILYLYPVVDRGATAPTWIYGLGFLAPLGFLITIIALVASNRK